MADTVSGSGIGYQLAYPLAINQQAIPITVQIDAPAAVVAAVEPHWTVYVTALGAPFVAIVAACIAGYMAWRNVQTARNKLKFDLWEKRMEVYEQLQDVFTIIKYAINEPETMSKVEDHYRIRGKAQWLFDDKVVHFLDRHLRVKAMEFQVMCDRRVIMESNPEDAEFQAAWKLIFEPWKDQIEVLRTEFERLVRDSLKLEH